MFADAGLAVALTTALAAPSMAAADEGISVSDTEQIVAAVGAVSPESLDDLAEVESDADGAVVFAEGGSGVEIPESVEDPVILESGTGGLEVVLPFAGEAAPVEVTDDGVAVFDNRNGSATVPVIHDDGSVQIHTVIDGPEAPTRYEYRLNLPENVTLLRVQGGGVIFVDENGDLKGGIAAPWARDAAHADVETWYEIDGHTITQVVDHSGDQAYPVVADPWLGIKIFSSVTVDTFRNQPRVNLKLSSWGMAIYGGGAQGGGVQGIAAGQAILNSAGWTEATTWSNKVKDALAKTSQRQQFECHALGWVADVKGGWTWNLEKARPNLKAHWATTVWKHWCNWDKSDGSRN